MKFGVLTFSYAPFLGFEHQFRNHGYYTINLGDFGQSIAIRHIYEEIGILPTEIVAVDRDTLRGYRGEPVVVITNGVFFDHCFPFPPEILPVFAGFHADQKTIAKHLDYIKRHEPIGCRDIITAQILTSVGVDATVTGCASMILPQRAEPTGPTKLFIVYGSGVGELPSAVLKHIPEHLLASAELIFHRLPVFEFPLSPSKRHHAEVYEAAILSRLAAEAKLVLTPLHHIATPCMAMRIPVVVCRNEIVSRFSLIETVLPVHTRDTFDQIDWAPRAVDTSEFRTSMIAFIERKISAIRHNA